MNIDEKMGHLSYVFEQDGYILDVLIFSNSDRNLIRLNTTVVPLDDFLKIDTFYQKGQDIVYYYNDGTKFNIRNTSLNNFIMAISTISKDFTIDETNEIDELERYENEDFANTRGRWLWQYLF